MQDTDLSILIVDDEPSVRSLLTTVLSPRFQCSAVASAGEAIALMESRFFHMALVDTGLPGMSGLALCRVIANRSPGTAVVVVSGNSDDQSIADAMAAGASDYIKKPFSLAEVVSIIERTMKRQIPGEVA